MPWRRLRRRTSGARLSCPITPLMTCYFTDESDPTDLIAGFQDGVFAAAKLYLARATTNSAGGVADVMRIEHVLQAMADAGMPLLVHGELSLLEINVFAREQAFIDRILLPLMERLPTLKIVLDNDAARIEVVRAHRLRLAGTLTPQHLLFNRNSVRGWLAPAHVLSACDEARRISACIAAGGSQR
jgi:dihydroorotase